MHFYGITQRPHRVLLNLLAREQLRPFTFACADARRSDLLRFIGDFEQIVNFLNSSIIFMRIGWKLQIEGGAERVIRLFLRVCSSWSAGFLSRTQLAGGHQTMRNPFHAGGEVS